MAGAADESCRVVPLEWDRGHEVVEGILRAETPNGVIITEINDLCPRTGLVWIRGDEVLELTDFDNGAATVRIATLRGARSERIDDALTHLPRLLMHLAESNVPIAIYRKRTGSSECLVGLITGTDDRSLHARELNTDGRYTGEILDFDLEEIIRVDWETDYLTALRELNESDSAERG